MNCVESFKVNKTSKEWFLVLQWRNALFRHSALKQNSYYCSGTTMWLWHRASLSVHTDCQWLLRLYPFISTISLQIRPCDAANPPPPPTRRNSPHWPSTSSLSRIHNHTHFDTPHSVGFLWTRDQPIEETSTGQHKTVTTDRPRRDSNTQSQQTNGRRPTS